MENRFNSVLYGIYPDIAEVLLRVPEKIKNNTEEIRLRRDRPVCLTVNGRPLFVRSNGAVSEFITYDVLKINAKQLYESFIMLCKNSVYAHSAELREGFIMMRSGHRAGVCGTFTEKGTFRDIFSLNIRIAREVFGSADFLVQRYTGGGVLIAGPPGSGKTTVLRDLIRQISSGNTGDAKRIAVVDSRGEISGSNNGNCLNELGANTDVLMIKNKAAGVEIALRTLFPDVIAFDEIGTAAELQGVAESFNAGVDVFTTAHAGSASDLKIRSVTMSLLQSGAVNTVAMLSGRAKKVELYSAREILDGVIH